MGNFEPLKAFKNQHQKDIFPYKNAFEIKANAIKNSNPDKFATILEIFSKINSNEISLQIFIHAGESAKIKNKDELCTFLMQNGTEKIYFSYSAEDMIKECLIFGTNTMKSIVKDFKKLKSIMNASSNLLSIIIFSGALLGLANGVKKD